MWESIFSVVSTLALIAWAILILLPRKPLVTSVIMYLGVAVLSFVYLVSMVSIQAGWVDPVPTGNGEAVNFQTLEGVQAIFGSKGGAVVGWVHYLAFDLFVGLWIAKDADAKDFSRILQAPILLLTFMLGPIGLFLWLVIRESRARVSGWKRKGATL